MSDETNLISKNLSIFDFDQHISTYHKKSQSGKNGKKYDVFNMSKGNNNCDILAWFCSANGFLPSLLKLSISNQ